MSLHAGRGHSIIGVQKGGLSASASSYTCFSIKVSSTHRAKSTRKRPSGSKPDMAQDMQVSILAILDTDSRFRSDERRRPWAAKTNPSSVWTPMVSPPFSAAWTAYSTCRQRSQIGLPSGSLTSYSYK